MKYISPIFSDARASVGGATFSSNRGGNYVRAKVAPVQPRSVKQQTVRAILATISGTWKSLTATEIAGWNSLASTITLKDTLGNSYKPTGAQLFLSNNANLTNIGQTMINNAPASAPAFEDITPITLTAAAGTPAMAIATSAAAAPTGFSFLVRATPQFSPGRTFVGQSQYRVINFYAATMFASINILAAYEAKFGVPVAAQKLQVEVTLVHIASGFQSQGSTSSAIVAA